jgi:hypothetical protein
MGLGAGIGAGTQPPADGEEMLRALEELESMR